jgi:hypothetical protein
LSRLCLPYAYARPQDSEYNQPDLSSQYSTLQRSLLILVGCFGFTVFSLLCFWSLGKIPYKGNSMLITVRFLCCLLFALFGQGSVFLALKIVD